MQNLVDSHDTDRVASMVVNAGKRPYSQPNRFDFDIGVSPRYVPTYDVRKPNDRERRVQRLIALLQMTFVGPPMVYYGTEAGMWGADDPCDRMPMIWQEFSYDSQQADPLGRKRTVDGVGFDEYIFGYYRAAIHMRRAGRALRRGDIEFIRADDQAEFLGYRRSDVTETLLVGLNRGGSAYNWNVALKPGQKVSRIFTASGEDDRTKIQQNGSAATVTIPPLDGVVLRVTGK
jgi:glycosidase